MYSMKISGKGAVVGTQLAEVFSIHIKPNDDNICGIYGTIFAKDELTDDVLVLYDQGSSSPDYVCARNSSLPLVSPVRPISASKNFTLYIDLKDVKDNSEFIHNSYTWDAETPISYDQCLSIPVNGELGSATIYFTILSVATTATVSVKLEKEVGGLGFGFYGSVVARYLINCESADISLFARTCDKPVLPEDEVQIPLSRSLLAVPVFSTLTIHVDLWQVDSGGQTKRVACGDVDFRPRSWGYEEKDVQTPDFSLNVVANWKHAEISPCLRQCKSASFFGGDIVDLYSVRIISDDMRGCKVYGDIHVGDCKNKMAIFNHVKDNSARLLSDDTIPLRGPFRSVSGFSFIFTLSLYEEFRELEICDGYFELPLVQSWKWYNSRVAAVIEGKNGCAVVHFSVFQAAVQANVEVRLCGVNGETAIYGSLIARIGNCVDERDYVKKYYQTRLLTATKDTPVPLMSECVPLHRNAVAVPETCPLIIEADLTHNKGVVRGSTTIFPQPSGGEYVAHIGQEDGGIDVKVSPNGVLGP